MPQTDKQIKYYFKEDTNQILVSGSDTVAKTNAILQLIKDPITQAGSFYNTKIVNYGVDTSYMVQNGPEFVSLILDQSISTFTAVNVDNANTGTAPIAVTGNISGTNGKVVLISSAVGGTFRITGVTVNETGSNWTPGETITIPQAQLINYNLQNPTADLVITLNSNNINQYGTEIPLKADQELWVYKGYNTVRGDGTQYRYNPHLHRAYKAYIVVETGSGLPSNPWLPVGNPINTSISNQSGGNIPGKYLEKQLAILGNSDDLTSNFVSGSFQIYNPSRVIHPFIFTKYQTLPTPPIAGAGFRVYLENTSSIYTNFSFSTSTNPPLGVGEISFNTTDETATTEIYIDSNNTISPLLNNISASYSYGKTGGKLRLASTANNYVQYDITDIDFDTPDTYYTVNVSYDVKSTPFTLFSNGANLTTTFSEVPFVVAQISQNQSNSPNITPLGFSSITFNKSGIYTYTSSAFPITDNNGNNAVGSTQFGLYTDYDFYHIYNARVDASNNDPVTVYFTSSANTSSYVEIPAGYNANIPALVGTLTQSGYNLQQGDPTNFNPNSTYNGANFDVIIGAPTQGTPTTPPDMFAKRWESVYISYSSSLSSSLDGLYVFNQLPQNDIQVTASMFITAWTGSAAGTTYGDPNSEYGTATYDVGEAGDGPTWPTASIRIYTGSYPNSIPSTLDAFVTQSEFRDTNIHVNGLAITMSYLIPSQSISLKDCLSLSLAVSSGSANSASVENSLVVREYYLEFNTPLGEYVGDGLVPTFIENAFAGTYGFSNAPDCQPMLNNASEGRSNRFIQEVDYSTGIYDPINFQAIISGSAQKSTVPESNYTQLASINPRYNGSESTSQRLNVWSIGDIGTYGKKPTVELRDAFFGYFNDISDPYPNINNLTRISLNYLIDEQGNALPPSLDNQLSIDTFTSVFPNTTLAKIAVKTGSSQFKGLGKPSPIDRLMQYVTPILYSQNSSNNYTNIIPLSGSGYISRYDNDDSNSVLFGRFTADGTASHDTTIQQTACSYKLNPSEAVVSPVGSLNPWAEGNNVNAFYSVSDWGGQIGSSLDNQQIVSLQTSVVTTFVSNTGKRGSDKEELKLMLKMKTGNGNNVDTAFNLEDVTCKVYTDDGNVTDLGSILEYGWFNISNIENYKDNLFSIGAFGSSWKINRWITSRVPITTEGIVCEVDWEMYETLFDRGLMRERKPKNSSGVKALEWTFKCNSGIYDIKAGDKVSWEFSGSFKDSRTGYTQGYFFPSGYSGSYTPTSYVGQGAYDHLLNESNTAQAPFWVFPTNGTDSNWVSYGSNATERAANSKNILIMKSPNMNEAYGTGFYQGYIEYIPGPSEYFPGNIEPEGTNFDEIKFPIELQEGDEIRFANNENFTYKILNADPPQGNIVNGVSRLRIVLDRNVDESVNKDFFLVRRPIVNSNTLYLQTPFPYSTLATASISSSIRNTGSLQSGSFALSGSVDGNGDYTASFSNLEKAVTPGILFPDFPTQYLIDSASIIVNDLITRRIIES
jgi:hypothetical protein